MKKYFGDKQFYKSVLTLAIPMVLQNFITNFVNMLDNLMVGAVGTEQMSGVSIANQLVFVFNLAVFGAISGIGIYTAQFYGKNDNEGIRNTLRFKLMVSASIAVIAVLIFIAFGDKLITLYLHESDSEGNIELTFSFAKEYLGVIIFGLVPFAISQSVSLTLRETGQTFVPMTAGFSAVAVNCIFNYLLIFGKFGFPQLGVKGAAIATVMSRFVELTILTVYALAKKEKHPYFKHLLSSFRIPKALLKQVTLSGMPLMLNELFWSAGVSLLNMSYSLFGIDVVAAVSISSTFVNLLNVFFLSLGAATGIIVGSLLGAAKFDEAKSTARKLTVFAILVSIVVAVILFSAADFIPRFYNTVETSRRLASVFIRISALFFPFVSVANTSYFVIRSGGKIWITIVFDSVYQMFLCVPVAFSMFYVFKSTIIVAYFVVIALDVIKASFGVFLMKKGTWLNNLIESE